FFFSSRRRHTRLVSDWSSDVCSSDLSAFEPADSGRRLIVNDHVQAIAEERHAPSIHFAFEKVGRALRVIGDQFNQMSALRRLDQIGRASCRERVEISVGGVSLRKKKE